MKKRTHRQVHGLSRPARPVPHLIIEPLEERRAPANVFIVTSAADDGSAGTLRYEIAASNAATTNGPNSITFDIGTSSSVQTISLLSPLPAITQPVTILGGDQTGTTYSSPGIILNGAGAGSGDGFDVTAGNSTIEGFVIQGFTGHGIMLGAKGGDEVINDAIGTNASLNGILANTMDGILINNVGGNAIQDCVISGNSHNGIEVTGASASNNLIGAGSTAVNANVGTDTSTGDFIGVDISGAIAVPNLLDGILIHGAANHTTITGDVVSGNSGNGIHITGTGGVPTGSGTTGNMVFGNYIGTDITGTVKLGNALDGILIDAGANATSIGDGTSVNANVISANLHNGIHITGTGTGSANQGTTGNTVQTNFIGTDITGTLALGNTKDGVLIDNGANDNTIGGYQVGNVISANGANGVHITGTGQGAAGANTTGNSVLGNFIGTDLTGTNSLSNSANGVLLDNGANTNKIGDGTPAGANVISANLGDGILIDGSSLVIPSGHVGTAKNSVLGNYIGTDVSGAFALGNTGDGILIENGATGNIIGSTDNTNVISANLNGVHISGAGTTGNTLLGNYIGIQADGSSALGNLANGILIDTGASANNIGNDTTGGGNVISSNALNGVYIAGADAGAAGGGTTGNVLLGNYIGADSTGSFPLGNTGEGVLIDNGANANKIGDGTAAGANVISANTGDGIHLNGSSLTLTGAQVGTANNMILGNFIGTDISGTAAMGNSADGILINNGASNNTVGGDTSHNIISSNLNGVVISGTGAGTAGTGTTGNTLLGNYIGTDINGLSSSLGNTDNGVVLNNGANANKIGDGAAGGANVISANGANGILIDGSSLTIASGKVGTSNNTVLRNFIGTDLTGTSTLGNTADGILIDHGATNNTIGSATTHNIISANLNGVHISSAGTTGNVLLGNYIGTDLTGTSALGNTADGVLIDTGASTNTIGAAGSHNVISANGANGVHITGTGAGAAGAGTTGNILLGNYIGPDLTGASALGNTADGVLIDNGANGNQVGNGTTAAANTISGNNANGIHIDGSSLTPSTGQVGTSNNSVLLNYIGTDGSGTVALGNSNDGVLIDHGATGNTIGSATSHNVISANGNNGVEITGSGATGNFVIGNFIGPDKSGVKPLGNANEGVYIALGASSNTIGGVTSGTGNVISANSQNGVHLDGAGTTLNSVLGNFIGTDSTGKVVMANGADGVLIYNGASANKIGNGTTAGANVISGNAANGIEINTNTTGSNTNLIKGNFIGTDLTGTLKLGNANNGIYLASSNGNVIGGETSGNGNTIEFNAQDGVTIASGTGNSIQQNSIYSNSYPTAGFLGIDIATGANNNINLPVITSAIFEGVKEGTNVSFTFSGAPNTTYQIELFDSPIASSSGFGEGKTPLTPVPISVTTNAGGTVTGSATGLPGGAIGTVISATATDSQGDTSGFSATTVTSPSSPVITSAPPVVENVTFVKNSRNQTIAVEFFFNVPLTASTVGAGSFELFSSGPHGTYATPIKLAKVNPVVYHTATNTYAVTVTTAKPLAGNRLIKVVVNGTTDPVKNSTGVALDGAYTTSLPSGNGVAGSDFDALVAFGSHLTYKDTKTNTVTLAVSHGAYMDLIEPFGGGPVYIELAKVISGKTALTGNVRAGKSGTGMTTLEAIIGLDGAIDKLSSAKFTVTDPAVTTLGLSAEDLALVRVPRSVDLIAPFNIEP